MEVPSIRDQPIEISQHELELNKLKKENEDLKQKLSEMELKQKEDERDWIAKLEKEKKDIESKFEQEKIKIQKELEIEIQKYLVAMETQNKEPKVASNQTQLEQQINELKNQIIILQEQNEEQFSDWKKSIQVKETEWQLTIERIQLQKNTEIENLKSQLTESGKNQEKNENIQNLTTLNDSVESIDSKKEIPLVVGKDLTNNNESNNSINSISNNLEEEPEIEWMDDSMVTSCLLCIKPFSALRRKHHCRRCGKIFCGKCSSKNILIPDSHYNTLERVCDLCHEIIIKKQNISNP